MLLLMAMEHFSQLWEGAQLKSWRQLKLIYQINTIKVVNLKLDSLDMLNKADISMWEKFVKLPASAF